MQRRLELEPFPDSTAETILYLCAQTDWDVQRAFFLQVGRGTRRYVQQLSLAMLTWEAQTDADRLAAFHGALGTLRLHALRGDRGPL